MHQFAVDTVAVAVEQESHGWEDQLGDWIEELSVVEAEAMTISDCTKYSHRPVVAMIPVVEAEEEHSVAVDVAKVLEEGSGRTQVRRQGLLPVEKIDAQAVQV